MRALIPASYERLLAQGSICRVCMPRVLVVAELPTVIRHRSFMHEAARYHDRRAPALAASSNLHDARGCIFTMRTCKRGNS